MNKLKSLWRKAFEAEFWNRKPTFTQAPTYPQRPPLNDQIAREVDMVLTSEGWKHVEAFLEYYAQIFLFDALTNPEAEKARGKYEGFLWVKTLLELIRNHREEELPQTREDFWEQRIGEELTGPLF